MKTKMIISAIAMLAVLAAAFAMVPVEQDDATVSSVTLDHSAVTISIGQTFQLTATPDDTGGWTATWHSYTTAEGTIDASGIASVSDGLVKGVTAGTAYIVVDNNGSAPKASCIVTVVDSTVVAYGETSGLEAIYYKDGKMIIDITGEISAPNVDVKVTYTKSTDIFRWFWTVTKAQTGLVLEEGVAAIKSVEVYEHDGTEHTGATPVLTLSNLTLTSATKAIKMNNNMSTVAGTDAYCSVDVMRDVKLSSYVPTNTVGATFVNWALDSAGTQIVSDLTVEKFLFKYPNTTTIYAIWNTDAVKYKVSFNDNDEQYTGVTGHADITGIDGLPETVDDVSFAKCEILATAPTSTNYDFVGWALSPTGEATYFPGTDNKIEVEGLGNETATGVTLYAIWSIQSRTITFNNATDGSYYFTVDGKAVDSVDVEYGKDITFAVVREKVFYNATDISVPTAQTTDDSSPNYLDGGIDSGYSITEVTVDHAVSMVNKANGLIKFDATANPETTAGSKTYKISTTGASSELVATVKASFFVSNGSYGLLTITKETSKKDHDYSYTISANYEDDSDATATLKPVSPTTWKIAAPTGTMTITITAAEKSGAATLEQFYVESIDNSGSSGKVKFHIMDDYVVSGTLTLDGTVYMNNGIRNYYMSAENLDNHTSTISSSSEVGSDNYEYTSTITIDNGYYVYSAQGSIGNDKTLTVMA